MAGGELAPVMTLDTSGIVALVSSTDPYHQAAVAALRDDRGPYYVPAAILAEVAYILEQRAGIRMAVQFVENLESGALTLDCGEHTLSRVRELMIKYDDLPLGLAD